MVVWYTAYVIPTLTGYLFWFVPQRCSDTLTMSLLRTPLALTRWTWSRSSYNMVNYQNFCSLPVTRQATRKGNLQDLNKLHQSLMTIRSCTSNSKTSAGDESKNATSSSQASNQATKLPEIKSMPSGLTDLVTKTSEAGWPSLQNISLLALRCKYFLMKLFWTHL